MLMCSGPVPPQHRAHPRTLNQIPGAAFPSARHPSSPPPLSWSRCWLKMRRSESEIAAESPTPCLLEAHDAPAGRRAWGAARDELRRHPRDGCGEMRGDAGRCSRAELHAGLLLQPQEGGCRAGSFLGVTDTKLKPQAAFLGCCLRYLKEMK